MCEETEKFQVEISSRSHQADRKEGAAGALGGRPLLSFEDWLRDETSGWIQPHGEAQGEALDRLDCDRSEQSA